MKSFVKIVATVAMLVTLSGCQSIAGFFVGTTKVAVCMVAPTADNSCHGVVTFTQRRDQVTIVADITGLRPNGTHGFHIHEVGDCSAPDASSAKGHYNPKGHKHGAPGSFPRHAGDLGNLHADANGHARYERVVHNISVDGVYNPIVGRAVIVHLNADDLTTQPTGGAGPRIGCGVIQHQADPTSSH